MQKDDLKEQILEAALELGEASSWETLNLHALADYMQISLEQIRQRYNQKDDIVEAWFDRADQAVLSATPSAEFKALSVGERLYWVMMQWFDALAAHRDLTGQMLLYKFEFGHIHLQALGITRISRTVQWFREAARVETTDLRRILEETGTTTIFLASFAYWLRDGSTNSEKTRKFLRDAINKAERCARLLGYD